MDDDFDDDEQRYEDEDAPQPEVARIRRKVHSAGRDGRVRSKTIAHSSRHFGRSTSPG
jgi:hypothetical protein